MSLLPRIKEIEAIRRSRVVVLGASNLDLDLLPPLYELLEGMDQPARLDVVMYCRGGAVAAARRLALLLDGFTDHLAFIVPHHCQSAGTILTLAGREVIAGPLALFSPIDPHLQAEGADEAVRAISVEDVRRFGEMASDWFGIEPGDAGRQALGVLSASIFPTTLTSLYRSVLESRLVVRELLQRHMAEVPDGLVDRLLFGWHSHGFAVTGDDLADLGLPVRRDAAVEAPAWAVARALAALVGGGTRTTPEAPWFDALLATRDGAQRRRRLPGPRHPSWEPCEPC